VWEIHPFVNLQRLELCYIVDGTRPSVAQFSELLQRSPKLQSLLIFGEILNSEELREASQQASHSIPAAVQLLDLESLSVTEFEAPESLNYTLRLFQAPHLKDLGISDIRDDGDGLPVDFTSTFELLSGRFRTIKKPCEPQEAPHYFTPTTG